VYASAEVDDRLVDVPEEAGDELVHPLLAHRLREPRRIGEIEEHDDQPSASRTMIGPQQNARQQFTADQPPGFVHRSDDLGNRKSERDDPKQIDRQPSSRKPMELIRFRVEQKLSDMPATINAAVMTIARTTTSPASGNRLSAAPRRDRAPEANPTCTAHTVRPMPPP
jgi:hypothetical protein